MNSWVSVDPGFRYLGLAFWEEDQVVSSELLEMRERGTKETFIDYRNEGLLYFYHKFNLIIPKVHAIVFETMPMNNITTQRVLVSMVISEMLTLAKVFDKQVSEISAREVKNLFIGDSKASKAKIRRAVLEKYPYLQRERKLGSIPFDEMDAVAIGDAWIRKKRFPGT